MDERAQLCFAQRSTTQPPGRSTPQAALKAYFRWATQAMSAYPESRQKVPAGLVLGRWSWGRPSVRARAGERIPSRHHPARSGVAASRYNQATIVPSITIRTPSQRICFITTSPGIGCTTK